MATRKKHTCRCGTTWYLVEPWDTYWSSDVAWVKDEPDVDPDTRLYSPGDCCEQPLVANPDTKVEDHWCGEILPAVTSPDPVAEAIEAMTVDTVALDKPSVMRCGAAIHAQFTGELHICRLDKGHDGPHYSTAETVLRSPTPPYDRPYRAWMSWTEEQQQKYGLPATSSS